ncbi:hypothetical protein [Nocardiopsis sp. LOL_012]|uniref:hypothetical protein n=1 Tax=Nocardiopsis sp. LOL_012 TaxID=3345409 RepID=UPI003A83EAFF
MSVVVLFGAGTVIGLVALSAVLVVTLVTAGTEEGEASREEDERQGPVPWRPRGGKRIPPQRTKGARVP